MSQQYLPEDLCWNVVWRPNSSCRSIDGLVVVNESPLNVVKDNFKKQWFYIRTFHRFLLHYMYFSFNKQVTWFEVHIISVTWFDAERATYRCNCRVLLYSHLPSAETWEDGEQSLTTDNAEDVLPPLPSSAATHDCDQKRLGAAVEQRCENTDNVDTLRSL